MNCRPYEYIVGADPVEKQYTWFDKLKIKLHLKKREFKTPVFTLCLNKNIFDEKQLISANGQAECLQIIDRPKPTFISSFVNAFGFYRDVKLWNPVKMEAV